MEATIQKWGNSNAIRIPKLVLNTVGMKENDRVEIIMHEDGFTVSKICSHRTLEERLESFYNKPVGDITIESEEIDFGEPVGGEEW